MCELKRFLHCLVVDKVEVGTAHISKPTALKRRTRSRRQSGSSFYRKYGLSKRCWLDLVGGKIMSVFGVCSEGNTQMLALGKRWLLECYQSDVVRNLAANSGHPVG